MIKLLSPQYQAMCTHNNTHRNKLVVFSGIALSYGDNQILWVSSIKCPFALYITLSGNHSLNNLETEVIHVTTRPSKFQKLDFIEGKFHMLCFICSSNSHNLLGVLHMVLNASVAVCQSQYVPPELCQGLSGKFSPVFSFSSTLASQHLISFISSMRQDVLRIQSKKTTQLSRYMQ